MISEGSCDTEDELCFLATTVGFDRKQEVNTGMWAGWINIICINIFHIHCSQIDRGHS